MLVEILFVIVLTIAVFYLFWMVMRSASAKIHTQYVLLSERFDLELTTFEPKLFGYMRPEPFVHGHYLDREMSISAPGRGLQNSRQSETSVKVTFAMKGLQAQLTATGLMQGMKQRDSKVKTRWSSGDASFDAAVDVRTNGGDRLKAALTPELRGSIQNLLKRSKGTLYIGDGALNFIKLGLVANDADREMIEGAVETLVALAAALEKL